MRTSSRPLLVLAAALTFAPGCDEPYDPAYADDEVLTPRCIGPGCSLGGLGNTSKIGDHALSNLSKTLHQSAANSTAGVRITGGIGYWFGNPYAITQIEVDADGELRLKLGTFWIAGPAVKNARLNLTLVPNDGSPAVNGRLVIADAKCEPGKLAPALSICRYEFVTDVVPADTDEYPMHAKMFGYYHVCPDEDEQGTLPASVKFSSVLSPQVTLYQSPGATPRIDLAPGYFINGCLNGAVSKGQYLLNAFYDATAFRGLHPSQRTAMLLMWMAWFGGKTRTIPGQQISPHDPIGGLFTWTGDPDWDIEAGYSFNGASCRGGDPSVGMHRYIIDPVLNLVGWANLPHCTAGNLGSMATLGVKVPANLW